MRCEHRIQGGANTGTSLPHWCSDSVLLSLLAEKISPRAHGFVMSLADAHGLLVCMLHGESTTHLAPPRNTKHRERLQLTQMTAKRHNSQTKHQAPSKGQPKSRTTPTSTGPHASFTATSCHNSAHPAGSSPGNLGPRSPVRSPGGLSRTATQTHHPHQRGHAAPPLIRRNWWTAKNSWSAAGEGKWGMAEGGDERRGGRAKAREWGG